MADFQQLYGKFKAADLTLLLVPLTGGALSSGYQDESGFPYIDRSIEITINSGKKFRNYLSYTIEREQIHGVFVLRTMKLLWTIKEDSGVRHFTTENKIRLSQTSYMSKNVVNASSSMARTIS